MIRSSRRGGRIGRQTREETPSRATPYLALLFAAGLEPNAVGTWLMISQSPKSYLVEGSGTSEII